MQTVLNLLKRELSEWKQEYRVDKYFYKGCEKDKNAIRDFGRCEKNIKEFEQAINILTKKNDTIF